MENIERSKEILSNADLDWKDILFFTLDNKLIDLLEEMSGMELEEMTHDEMLEMRFYIEEEVRKLL